MKKCFVLAFFLCVFASSTWATNELEFNEKAIRAAVLLESTTLPPVKFYNAHIQCPRVESGLAVLPKEIKKIAVTPDNWRAIDIGAFSAKLPQWLFDKVVADRGLYSSQSQRVSVVFSTMSNIELQHNSFDYCLSAMNTTADDLVNAKTKEQAALILEKIICKMIGLDGLQGSYVVKTKYINAILHLYDRDQKFTVLDVWSFCGDAGMRITILGRYDLEFICQILSGIEPSGRGAGPKTGTVNVSISGG